MLQETFQLMPLWAFVASCAVAIVAGIVKGAVGFALPLVMVSGMTLFLDPLLAVAGLLLPTVLSNLMQAMRFTWSEIVAATREYWRYIAIVCVMIVLVAQLITLIPTQVFYLVLGVPVMGLSLVQLFGWRFHIPPHRRVAAEWGVGLFAGGLGGITGTWGPPTVLYLIALDTPKAKQILVQGIVYSLGAISLIAGHLQSGVLTAVTVPFSVALLIPAFVGMRIGFWYGDRIDPDRFRKLTLIVLVIAGANLLRRGIMG